MEKWDPPVNVNAQGQYVMDETDYPMDSLTQNDIDDMVNDVKSDQAKKDPPKVSKDYTVLYGSVAVFLGLLFYNYKYYA
jgi:tetrahydromethanopterin S-methyltransferase subunit G